MALMQERNRLFAYPLERLAGEIAMAGFQCTACGQCCARGTEGPVFLLDNDIPGILSIDPAAIFPVPHPDFCDQAGVLYVPGYALRTKEDAAGSCWFLERGRCRIYDRRATTCRLYPYKLRREPEISGSVSWKLIAHSGMHGQYHSDLLPADCLTIAREIKEHENALLTREISYLEYIQEYFAREGLVHSEAMLEGQLRSLARGREVLVMVYFDGDLVPHSPESDR